MVYVADPEWYFTNQGTPMKFYSNAVFLLLAAYYLLWKNDFPLSILFSFLFLCSSLFHWYPNRETLFVDRMSMILLFSYYFHLFYPYVPFTYYGIAGILTVVIWYFTEELLYYFLYQTIGIILYFIYYPMKMEYKLAFIAAYVGITYSQLLNRGEYHGLKHILLGLLSLFIYPN
jgi:hypothetical protein